jgi:hypothetical protein
MRSSHLHDTQNMACILRCLGCLCVEMCCVGDACSGPMGLYPDEIDCCIGYSCNMSVIESVIAI